MLTAWEDMSRIEQLQCIFWDLYKDVYGFRPRHISTDFMTEAELEAELNSLQAEGERRWAAEKAEQDRNVVALEARIQSLIDMGAGDRTTAIRWIDQAEQSNGDLEYLCYLLNVPYGYFGAVVFTQQTLESA